MPDPSIPWDSITPQRAGASRHPSDAPPPSLTVWRCPSCGVEQQGRLELGCTSCGAGAPGKKAEPKPVVPSSTSTVRTSSISPVETFNDWVRLKDLAPQLKQICWEAFMVGYGASQRPSITTEPSDYIPQLHAGTVEARTLIAALELFIDQVLQGGPDECLDGTWLGADEARELIKKLEAGR